MRYGALNVPPMINPRQVVAGFGYSCAIDDTGLQCWGINNYGQQQVPSLVEPEMVSAGHQHVCAVDLYGLRCWGDDAFGKSQVPSLVDPTRVTAGTHHSCAVDDGEIICWGYNGWGQTDPVDSRPTYGSKKISKVTVTISYTEAKEATVVSRPARFSGALFEVSRLTGLEPALSLFTVPTARLNRLRDKPAVVARAAADPQTIVAFSTAMKSKSQQLTSPHKQPSVSRTLPINSAKGQVRSGRQVKVEAETTAGAPDELISRKEIQKFLSALEFIIRLIRLI